MRHARRSDSDGGIGRVPSSQRLTLRESTACQRPSSVAVRRSADSAARNSSGFMVGMVALIGGKRQAGQWSLELSTGKMECNQKLVYTDRVVRYIEGTADEMATSQTLQGL